MKKQTEPPFSQERVSRPVFKKYVGIPESFDFEYFGGIVNHRLSDENSLERRALLQGSEARLPHQWPVIFR
jgi:hypothetical protein